MGVGRESARALDHQTEQDLIFEIDPDTVRLVSCFDDRIEQ
jgi:hypothetical protein